MSDLTPAQILEQQKANCPFCAIVAGKIPANKVYEDDQILAVADINPLSKGHIIILPKEHYPILPMVPAKTSKHLFERIKYLSKAVKEAAPCAATTVFIANGAAAGQQSPHVLIHIIPRDLGDGLPFSLKTGSIDDAKAQQLASAMQTHVTQIFSTVTTEQKKALATYIDGHPEIQELLLTNPEELKKKISEDEQLQKLFTGVNIDSLSKRLSTGGNA
ncbi:MAG TPA: HIT family protein [Acidobacteriota bacterium]|nr:HIT family protein [Acidobacteriota bacterium]